MNNKAINRELFISFLQEILCDFSPAGRERILNDLKRTKNQILCSSGKIKSISKIGSPSVNKILTKLQSSKNYEDQDINWTKTEGVKFDLIETRKAAKFLCLQLEKVNFNNKEKFVECLLKELSRQNDTLLRKLAVLKYKSKSPGGKLVGKQTKLSKNNNLGFVYEHTIPMKYLIKEVVDIVVANKTNEKIDFIFSKLISVELNTDHDDLILKSGLRSKMPSNWQWDHDPLDRYWASGIPKESLRLL
jgi:hypothetical protein